MKKILFTLLACIIICAAIYAGINRAMVKDVKNIKTDFFNIVSGNVDQSIDYGALKKYDYTRYFDIESVDNLECEIESVFHDFRKGHMNVRYSFSINPDDENHSVGASRVESKWYIRKSENRWIVYKIDENA